jgi:menaquinol-cytochrome c reductase iron-sulfur subunit
MIAMQSETAEKQVDRRTFMNWVIAGIGAFITAAVGIPLVGAAIMPALKKSRSNEVSAGPVTNFPLGEPKSASVTITRSDGWVEAKEDRGIWVVRTGEYDFTVYNGRCVHLGCAYSWVPAQNQFVCPCHGGHYTLDGQVTAGPPPRPLDTLQWRVDQGNLIVRYEDFRLGIPQKEMA